MCDKIWALDACHIKPHSSCTDEEKMDPNNAICLMASIHRAFDIGFISFDAEGVIMISPRLTKVDRECFGLIDGLKIRMPGKSPVTFSFIEITSTRVDVIQSKAMTPIDIIGWVAAAILAMKAVPQVMKSHRKGNGKGLSPTFLWLWLVGQSLMLTYLLLQPTFIVPVITTVAINLVMVIIIMRYRYFPRKDK